MVMIWLLSSPAITSTALHETLNLFDQVNHSERQVGLLYAYDSVRTKRKSEL
jgi:hypothetical protein